MSATIACDPTEMRGVAVSKSFPTPAFAIVEGEGDNVTVKVAQRTNNATDAKPIKSFGTEPTDAWAFGANTMNANIVALARMSRFLEKEAQALGKPIWQANIHNLIGKLDEAVKSTEKLCDDTNTTLAGSHSS